MENKGHTNRSPHSNVTATQVGKQTTGQKRNSQLCVSFEVQPSSIKKQKVFQEQLDHMSNMCSSSSSSSSSSSGSSGSSKLQTHLKYIVDAMAWKYDTAGTLQLSLSVANSLAIEIFDRNIDFLIRNAVNEHGTQMDVKAALTILAKWLVREKMWKECEM